MSLGEYWGHSDRTGDVSDLYPEDGPFKCTHEFCNSTSVEDYPCISSPVCQCVRSSKSSFTFVRKFSDYPFFVCSTCELPTKPFLVAFVENCKRGSNV